MTLRADHVAGAAFIAFGILVIAISGSLPFGNLSSPGSGFLPIILSVLMMLFGATLMVRAGESRPFATLAWSDARHAAMVVLITAVAIAVFEPLGFATSNVLMMLALLLVIERRGVGPAALYSVGVVGITYVLFVYLLKTPLETGPFGF
ncbi:MAG: tripartite tricarboxylate transporter TctB family protein [Pseudolabrys sp.]